MTGLFRLQASLWRSRFRCPSKLKQLGEASDDAWEQLKVGVESAWGALSAAIRNAAAKFKG